MIKKLKSRPPDVICSVGKKKKNNHPALLGFHKSTDPRIFIFQSSQRSCWMSVSCSAVTAAAQPPASRILWQNQEKRLGGTKHGSTHQTQMYTEEMPALLVSSRHLAAGNNFLHTNTSYPCIIQFFLGPQPHLPCQSCLFFSQNELQSPWRNKQLQMPSHYGN